MPNFQSILRPVSPLSSISRIRASLTARSSRKLGRSFRQIAAIEKEQVPVTASVRADNKCSDLLNPFHAGPKNGSGDLLRQIAALSSRHPPLLGGGLLVVKGKVPTSCGRASHRTFRFRRWLAYEARVSWLSPHGTDRCWIDSKRDSRRPYCPERPLSPAGPVRG